MAKTMKIWSKRWSVTQGNHWAHERDCTTETAKEWLSVFQGDEPNVIFVCGTKKPR